MCPRTLSAAVFFCRVIIDTSSAAAHSRRCAELITASSTAPRRLARAVSLWSALCTLIGRWIDTSTSARSSRCSSASGRETSRLMSATTAGCTTLSAEKGKGKGTRKRYRCGQGVPRERLPRFLLKVSSAKAQNRSSRRHSGGRVRSLAAQRPAIRGILLISAKSLGALMTAPATGRESSVQLRQLVLLNPLISCICYGELLPRRPPPQDERILTDVTLRVLDPAAGELDIPAHRVVLAAGRCFRACKHSRRCSDLNRKSFSTRLALTRRTFLLAAAFSARSSPARSAPRSK